MPLRRPAPASHPTLHRRVVACLLALVLLMAACGDDEALPEVGEILGRAADAMQTVTSARFEMSVTGAPIRITGLGFSRAVGDYAAPDRARAALTMTAGDVTIELATIGIGTRVWLTDPLSGRWTELPAGVGFNPSIVFGREGWHDLLANELADAEVTGRSDGAVVVVGTAPRSRVEVLTGGLVADQDVTVELLVDPTTARIRSASFATTGDGGTTDWAIRLGPYDDPVTVDPPPSG